ncbi:NADH dehydrogenase [Ancylobacter sp. 3268]|uniref:NAD(P)/FAD-dependent oxidoreductase n=1 Tax=Ancylobacter sp. 3268 TaxID=2817752 RepID=UPI0028565D65|nr:NAD(P)/FAD-dependent oxidoreductase [Ancylobacter sp. 3268]MDR6950666.1 NADH dehydrogenase [Ancylobacter sp. 3268]
MVAVGKSRERVVIVGAGFAGLSAAKVLAGTGRDVTVIDRHNYHLFQPLLYQVATAVLSPADIASPIRGILHGRTGISVVLGEVSGVDLDRREVIAEGRRFGYDHLVLATGARHAFFGHEHWAAHACGLKRIDDATDLRRRLLLAFERAESESDAARRRALLTFVVVGGGPTGVEMAGAIAELSRKALTGDFLSIDPGAARVVLVEADTRLLTPFHPALSEAARRSLAELGVEVRLERSVTGCDADGVELGDERIDATTVIWAAGVMASPAGIWLGASTDRVGRVKVGPDLSLPGHPEIFVLGDTAHVETADGRPLPGIAPVAKQQGLYVAKLLQAKARGRSLPPFRYRGLGMMATIGRKRAVAQIGLLRISGYPAWLLWSLAHIYFLIGFRNRFVVALNWGWNYLTHRRGARLITGLPGARPAGHSATLSSSEPEGISVGPAEAGQ